MRSIPTRHPDGTPREDDTEHSHVDISNAKALLEYEPKIDTCKGVNTFIAWNHGSANCHYPPRYRSCNNASSRAFPLSPTTRKNHPQESRSPAIRDFLIVSQLSQTIPLMLRRAAEPQEITQ